MTRWAPHKYYKIGVSKGISEKILSSALKQAHRTQDKDLPPILTLGHLAFQIDIPYWKIRQYVTRESRILDSYIYRYTGYRTFNIKKKLKRKRKEVEYRVISVPEIDLMKTQRWIDKFILTKIDTSPFSYAFTMGKSISDCAEQHLGCKWLIKIDLRNFFESLYEIQVYKIFKDCGYNNLVSFELARICTKSTKSKLRLEYNYWRTKRSMRITEYNRIDIGHLPQGAPTSPKLANLIVK